MKNSLNTHQEYILIDTLKMYGTLMERHRKQELTLTRLYCDFYIKILDF